MVRLIIIALLFTIGTSASAQYPPFTKWYQNPLGFKPLNLHTANGIIIPAIAATSILLLTRGDSSISKRIAVYTDAGLSYGYYASKTRVFQSNVGIHYNVRSYLSLGAEFTTYQMHDDVNNTWGFGVRPFVRFYPVHRNNFKAYFQSGAGLIYFMDEYPQPSGFFGDNRTGTHLNGSPKYGLGVEIKLSPHISATFALWHVHISNGNHPSRERNPGHDSNGFSVGLIFP